MQHRSIDDSTSHRLHQFGVGNAIEVAPQIGVNNLSMATVKQLVNLSDSVQCAAVCAIGILFRLQVGFDDRLQHQNGCCLRDAIPHRRYA